MLSWRSVDLLLSLYVHGPTFLNNVTCLNNVLAPFLKCCILENYTIALIINENELDEWISFFGGGEITFFEDHFLISIIHLFVYMVYWKNRTVLGEVSLRFERCFHLLDLRPWANHLISLIFIFFIYKMRVIIPICLIGF